MFGREIFEPAREVAERLLLADEVARVALGLVPPQIDAAAPMIPSRIVEPRAVLRPREPVGWPIGERAIVLGLVGKANLCRTGESEARPALNATRIVFGVGFEDAFEIADALLAVEVLVRAAAAPRAFDLGRAVSLQIGFVRSAPHTWMHVCGVPPPDSDSSGRPLPLMS